MENWWHGPTNGVDGLLVEPDSIAAWQDALQRLICDGGLLARLRSGVRPPRQMEQVVVEMQTLYTRLCDEEYRLVASATRNQGSRISGELTP